VAQGNQVSVIDSLVKQEGIERVDLSDIGVIAPDVLQLIPDDIALRHKVIPLSKTGDTISVTMANPFDLYAEEAVRSATPLRPMIHFTPAEQVDEWLGKLYMQGSAQFEEMDESLEAGVEVEEEEQEDDLSIEVLRDQAQDAPAVRFVNKILLNAVQERASDIHIEPQENDLKVRFRIDGALRIVATPHKQMQAGIISRIKILGSLDIAERRIPQDGRSKLRLFGRSVDIRISTLPTIYGEKIVLRILDKDRHSLNVADLGLEQDLQERYRSTLQEPHGIVLVTGPTGSGKTTTLYSALNYVNSQEQNIITIEDPVEYQLNGVNQIQTKSEVGLTFAAGLRSILRQDPDIIMVGEIRDMETAEIAMRAALTGHLVFSTLHTNNSIATITRLIEMGIDKYLICSSIVLILAQRLVRRICFHCSEPYTPPTSLLQRFENVRNLIEHDQLQRGRGCSHCGGTGYWGRVAIFEFLYLNNSLRHAIMNEVSMDEFRRIAEKEGMETLLLNGLKKVNDGVTTIDEIVRVTTDIF
jgi:type IV pilus assembly protein PilB